MTTLPAVIHEKDWIGRPQGDLMLALMDYGCTFDPPSDEVTLRNDMQFDVDAARSQVFYRTPKTSAGPIATDRLIADLPGLLGGRACLRAITSERDGPHMIVELEGGPPAIDGTSRDHVPLAENPWPGTRKGEVLDLVSTRCDVFESNPTAARPWLFETVTLQLWLADLDGGRRTIYVDDVRAIVPQPDGTLGGTRHVVADAAVNAYVARILETKCYRAEASTRNNLINLYLVAGFDDYRLPTP